MAIWVNEQIDPSGLIYSCIACYDKDQAQECNRSFEENLTEFQKESGWIVRMRTVESWDDVPVNALKLD
ncbi:glycogen debranching protein [Kovacikia minuta CCNUW1]|uniref:glycogen debranching protein n=1 Tax=Kovacikia minuta TaxID=2931930 RepID=UPI001CC9D09C|nr:glycogen debranching protein [Kovacikia minuta]UBF23789.1 glycogen debranching protein [Kovacikia minuta CCNUW1]